MVQWCLFLLLILLAVTGVHSQPDFHSNGFLKRNVKIIITIAVVVVLLVIAVAIVILVLKRRKRKRIDSSAPYLHNYYPKGSSANPDGVDSLPAPYIHNYYPEGSSAYPDAQDTLPHYPKSYYYRNQQIAIEAEHIFSHDDLKNITNNFRNKTCAGEYGSVYLGYLQNTSQVAVKMFPKLSDQQVNKFLVEAEFLSKFNHKNLVRLVGYCIDESFLALVYEYIDGGNLHDKLKNKAAPLTWKQRLQIAYESAVGLEYLHTGRSRSLYHRDVNTSNILLNANLEAKIAYFGLVRDFDNGLSSHGSTTEQGDLDNWDPVCFLSLNDPSIKIDVFGFGVVLLEIITGRAPTDSEIEGGNLVEWVQRQLHGGDNIEAIVDSTIHDKYDKNSITKIVELALRCTRTDSSMRPTMSVLEDVLNAIIQGKPVRF